MNQALNVMIRGSAIAALIVAGGCAATHNAGAENTGSPPIETAAASPSAGPQARTEASSPAVLLRTALLPGDAPQPVHILLRERRESAGVSTGEWTHQLEIEISGTLRRKDSGSADAIKARLKFEHVRMAFGLPDRPDAMLRFDSATDEAGQGNPLADIMVHVADAELDLTLTPNGRLRELRGLDARWGRAHILLVEPGLMTAQWHFRDAGMLELIGEALFPPMPASPVRVNDAWALDVPANIPLVTRLDARMRSKLEHLDGDGPAVATIRGEGRIVPAAPLIENDAPAVRPLIQRGSVTLEQTVSPDEHTLTQRSTRELDITLTLTPPKGEERLQMNLKQSRTLESKRGG